ncbi:hypothetical protein BCR44DRAFT_58115 [Catenaria anguillulae PL171]|uniref:Uncharacterized protein n=1 Tax=Catenaria anguillulae PL171 TaxID=765915 RepID=A0A1Y2H3T1_9FUNG|nr:hypothetical protein BCR44DRAFT_58115 [Catenaria anguillulae PL171]
MFFPSLFFSAISAPRRWGLLGNDAPTFHETPTSAPIHGHTDASAEERNRFNVAAVQGANLPQVAPATYNVHHPLLVFALAIEISSTKAADRPVEETQRQVLASGGGDKLRVAIAHDSSDDHTVGDQACDIVDIGSNIINGEDLAVNSSRPSGTTTTKSAVPMMAVMCTARLSKCGPRSGFMHRADSVFKSSDLLKIVSEADMEYSGNLFKIGQARKPIDLRPLIPGAVPPTTSVTTREPEATNDPLQTPSVSTFVVQPLASAGMTDPMAPTMKTLQTMHHRFRVTRRALPEATLPRLTLSVDNITSTLTGPLGHVSRFPYRRRNPSDIDPYSFGRHGAGDPEQSQNLNQPAEPTGDDDLDVVSKPLSVADVFGDELHRNDSDASDDLYEVGPRYLDEDGPFDFGDLQAHIGLNKSELDKCIDLSFSPFGDIDDTRQVSIEEAMAYVNGGWLGRLGLSQWF